MKRLRRWPTARPAGRCCQTATSIASLGADADTVYVWEAVFDFSSPYPSILHALRHERRRPAAGRADVPSRLSARSRSLATWSGCTSTGIYSQEHASDLDRRSTARPASTVTARHFDDNMYGWATTSPSAAGKVVFTQGGSFGGSTPAHDAGLRPGAVRRPTIADKVIPLGRVGTALLPPAHRRRCPRTTRRGRCAAGALPSGLTLSTAGLIGGTPTAAQTTRATVQVASSNGRSLRRGFTVTHRGTEHSRRGSAPGATRAATRSRPATATLDLEDATTFGYRWKTAAPGRGRQRWGRLDPPCRQQDLQPRRGTAW